MSAYKSLTLQMQNTLTYSTSRMTTSAKLVAVVLVCYFGFVMYRAINKLQSRDVGTMFATKSEDTVQGDTI